MADVDLKATQLASGIPFALAYRGYNQTNLGKTPDLLGVPAYEPILRRWFSWADRLCSRHAGLKTDLVRRVRLRQETPPSRYAEAVALVFAIEMAHLDIAREVHGFDVAEARMAIGYSLGELVALAAGGFVAPEAVLSVPLALAEDCAALAEGSRLAVVFSRTSALPMAEIEAACDQLSNGEQAIALSAILSPNTALLIGQGDLLDKLPRLFPALSKLRFHTHTGVWPPLHTPLVRQQGVCDRARQMIGSAVISAAGPSPPIFSLVTGKFEYASGDPREVLAQWIDRPQRLWDAVQAILASDVRRVVHLGPEPNVIPATFSRLADNVRQQTDATTTKGLGLRTMQSIVERRWLASIVPANANLLRAPQIEHVVFEDWLLAHAPEPSETSAASADADATASAATVFSR